jgi:hypothetical protein
MAPALTVLEDRTVLSTLTVTSAADDGSSGTLRAVIGAASPGDTITFAKQLKGSTITLQQGELSITQNLDIESPGAAKLTISGGDASRVFDVAGGMSLTLTGLTITHGRYDTTLGGSLLTYGGGGILNEPGASLSLVQDTLSFNQAVGHQTLGVNGQDELGGAIFNLGKVTVSACTFTNNQVLGGGDANSNMGGSAGGAIDNYDGATLTATDSLFSNNTVVSADGAGYFSLGGAIETNAGTGEHGDNTPSTATLTNCTFLNNLSEAGALNTSNGGAIVSEGVGTLTTLTNCEISNNRSVGGDGGFNNQGDGGGVMNEGGGTMVIAGCQITSNLAMGGNNGDLTKDTRSGAGYGGGVIDVGILSISDSLISGNVAQGGTTATGPGGIGYGGGIVASSGSTLTVTDSSITNDSAIAGFGGAGGGLHTTTSAGFAFGGGIDVTSGSTATLVGCTIFDNVAQGSAGASGNAGGDGVAGGVGVGGVALRGPFIDTSKLYLVNSTVSRNQAIGGAGGSGATGGNGLGGGLAIAFGSSASLTASTVEKNSAVGGARGQGASDGNGLGGGVYVFDLGTFTYDPTTQIKKNRASTGNDNIFP